MSDAQWHFKPQPKGFRDRNPIQNAFFDSEAVGSVVSALIREGLQNSGDARSKAISAGLPVTVRIYTSGDKFALGAERAAFWARDLWSHIGADDCGLRRAPDPADNCPFLVFEDFGTTGLIGSTISDQPCREPFYCFFRAENATSKTGDTGGSWGVGKTAFPRASRANALIAMSCRESDERCVLMGSMTLRTRHVDGVKFCPDSWFGIPEEGEDNGGIVQPIEDHVLITRFCEDFRLKRDPAADGHERYGTSIVVPWCSEEFTAQAIIRAVIESNFLPIVCGAIEVSVGSTPDHDEDTVLSSETIEAAVEALGDEVLLASVRLARWGREKAAAERVSAVHEPSPHSVQWDQYSLADADRDRLRERFDAGHPISVRVGVPMKRKKEGGEHTSHIEVALQRTPDGSTIRPVFVRGTVVVPDQRIKRVPGALAIIRTENDELGNLLRAAEDPGHKEWSADTDNFYEFKETYKYAKSYLTLARDAALRVNRMLQDIDAEEDFDLLGDVFSLTRPPEEDGIKPGQKGKKKRTRQPITPPPPRQRIIEARQIEGGFCVVPASDESATPAHVTVWAGYDRRKGDPIHKWDPADFRFDRKPISMDHVGVEIEENDGNKIKMKVIQPDFRLAVTGFEASRGDVVVRVRPEGRFDAEAV